MAKILIVDDEGAVRQAIQTMLDDSGHRFQLACDGREAMKLAGSQCFDIAIVDIVMPEKEGIETIMDLRRQVPTTKVIAMSGGGQALNCDYLRFARRLGAVEALRKPFVQRDLLRAVNRCLTAGLGPQSQPQPG